MSEIKKNFCNNFFEWQSNYFKGTQKELGSLFGVSQGQIAKVLSGKRAGDEEWRRKVASKIGMPYEIMIGLNKNSKANIKPIKIEFSVKLSEVKNKLRELKNDDLLLVENLINRLTE